MADSNASPAGMMQGHFVSVRPAFGFVRPDGEDGNVYVTGTAIASLRRHPRRGDRVRFRIAETPDGRRRAVDLALMEPKP